jgi:hypothetical protein
MRIGFYTFSLKDMSQANFNENCNFHFGEYYESYVTCLCLDNIMMGM